jgi:hypothetical protein
MARTRAQTSIAGQPPSVVDVSSSDDGGEKPPSYPVKRTSLVYSGRRKRSATKSKFPMVFSDSDSEEEISKTVYRDLRREWKRLKKENHAMEAFAEIHRLEVEKSLPVALLQSEVKHLKGLVERANKAKEEVETELVEIQRALKNKETVVEALRAGLRLKVDQNIEDSLKIGSLEDKVEGLLFSVIPHLYQATIDNPDEGKRLVELAAKPGVRIAELLPEESFNGSHDPDDPVSD